MTGIPIEVMGFKGRIIDIVADKESLLAILEFDPPVHGLISLGVEVPVRRYKRDELALKVAKGAVERIEKHIESRNKEQQERRKKEQLDKLAQQVRADLELDRVD